MKFYMSKIKGDCNTAGMKELYEPWILIPFSSKSVEKFGSCGRLNICKWTLIEAAFL